MKIRSLPIAIGAMALSLGMSAAVHAQSGTITANPTQIIVPPGPSQTGTAILSWNAAGVTRAVVTVECVIGFGEIESWNTGPGPHSEEIRLYAGDQCTYRLRPDSISNQELASVVVTGMHSQHPVGTISANPVVVSVPANETMGWTTLEWATQNNPQTVDIRRNCNGEEVVMASGLGPNGQRSVEIPPDRVCQFRLYTASPFAFFLAEVTVESIQEPSSDSISANPARVLIPSNAATGSTLLSWTAGIQPLEIRRNCNGVESTVASGLAATGETLAQVPMATDCDFILRATGSSNTSLAQVRVEGAEAPPPGNACPPMCDHDNPVSQHDYGCTIAAPEDTLHYDYEWSTLRHWRIFSADGPSAFFTCPGAPNGRCSTFGVQIRVTNKADGSLICQGSRNFSGSGSEPDPKG